MHRGYVKLWRKSLDTEMLKNHKLWAFWCYCLMKATHKKKKVTIGYQEVTLEPGQFIFGREKASHETGLAIKSVRTCVENLKKQKKLAIKSTNKYSIITIINWDTYQQDGGGSGQQNGQQLANNWPTTGQQLATYKNVKNVKNVKNTDLAQRQNAATPDETAVVSIPLIQKDGNYKIYQEFIDKYQEYYPGIDVLAELRACAAWNEANPKNRKTRSGIERHINFWLSKAQNRKPSNGYDKSRVVDIGGKTVSKTTKSNLELLKRRQKRRAKDGQQEPD
jgi:hypothetical protein